MPHVQLRLHRIRRAVRGKGRSGLRYRRFPQAAEAIRYAIERLPRKVFLGTSLEVNDERYNAAQIRALYETTAIP
jgi:hypothetical protein